MAQHNPTGIVIGKSHGGHRAMVSKTASEGSVIARAVERAGRNPHIKNRINEALVKDVRNARNLLSLNGASTKLTKNTTAGTVDLMTTKGGKVIERLEVKGVTSQASIYKLVKQCVDGKYRIAQLIGSEESAQAFNKAAKKAGISKRKTSTGVSSKSARLLPQRMGATGSGSLSIAMGLASKAGSATGAIIAGGVATFKGCIDLIDGRADAVEVAGTLVKDSVKAGVLSAAAGAAATANGAGTEA